MESLRWYNGGPLMAFLPSFAVSKGIVNVAQVAERISLAAVRQLPEAADFPRHPATWYLFCRSTALRRKPLSRKMLDRHLVAYRLSSGRVAMLDANCAHLGADLGRGRIQGDTIQCPFHHWSYSSDGRCVSVPGSGCVPKSARLRSYPVVERHGYVFFFLGREPLFPLPFFLNCDSEDFIASQPFQFQVDSPWFMLVANGFDGQHFQAVHDRRLTATPKVDCPAPFARRMRFEAEVAGHTIFDQLLRRFVGKHVRVSITSWGGPHVLVEGVFERAHSRLLVASQPLDEHNTLSDVIAFARRGWQPVMRHIVDPINLRVRRRFTQAFLQYDIDKLRGVRYQPEGLTEQDREMINYFHWLTTLPRSEYEDPPR
jgi:nitrite reductase/ring-hydroxylating ferredoxin subunit